MNVYVNVNLNLNVNSICIIVQSRKMRMLVPNNFLSCYFLISISDGFVTTMCSVFVSSVCIIYRKIPIYQRILFLLFFGRLRGCLAAWI